MMLVSFSINLSVECMPTSDGPLPKFVAKSFCKGALAMAAGQSSRGRLAEAKVAEQGDPSAALA